MLNLSTSPPIPRRSPVSHGGSFWRSGDIFQTVPVSRHPISLLAVSVLTTRLSWWSQVIKMSKVEFLVSCLKWVKLNFSFDVRQDFFCFASVSQFKREILRLFNKFLMIFQVFWRFWRCFRKLVLYPFKYYFRNFCFRILVPETKTRKKLTQGKLSR